MKRVLFLLFFVNSTAAAEPAAQPPRQWTIGGGFGWTQERPSIDVEGTSKITVPGGASYLSSSAGSLRLRTRQENLSVTLTLPRGQYLGWSFELGTVSYQVWIPSGSVDNQLSRSQGTMAGVCFDADVVRRTMVTPRINARLSWRFAQSQPDRIYLATQDRWEAASSRWQVTTVLALSVLVEPSFRQGKLLPQAGFEIFRKAASLKDNRSGEVVAGSQNGYRLFGGGAWWFSASEALTAQVSLGDETGYRIGLEQRF